jgi:hypothetical protein
MIHIYPKHHLTEAFYQLPKTELTKNWLWNDKDYLFFINAKNGIHYLVNLLGLQREDEVFISTSSDKNYVSTCVSATLFNYCKISRVLTEKTKLIYVIHEFGVPNPATENLVLEAKKRNIPLLEDCAHGIESYINGIRIGFLGDYALYSLPKHLPMENGGLLVGKHLPKESDFYDANIAEKMQEDYNKFLPYLPYLSQKRKENFKFITENLKELPLFFEYSDNYTPYSVNFVVSNYQKMYQELSGKVGEWLLVYIKDWFCVPTQPLMSEMERWELVCILKKQIILT